MNLIDKGFFEKIKENYCWKDYKSFNSSIRNNEIYNTKMKNKANNIIKNKDYNRYNENIDKLKNMPFYFYFNRKEINGKYQYYVIKLCFNDQYFDEMKSYFNKGSNKVKLPNNNKDIVDEVCKQKKLLKKNPYLFCVPNKLPISIIQTDNKSQDITGCGMNYLSILQRNQNNVINFLYESLYPYLLPYFTYNKLTLKGILNDAELVYSTFTNVTFDKSTELLSNSNWIIQKINNSNFEHSTFNKVNFNIIIDNNNFSNCIFKFVNFKKISIQTFFQCFFENTTFEITKNTAIVFEKCVFSDNNTIHENKLNPQNIKYGFVDCDGIKKIILK